MCILQKCCCYDLRTGSIGTGVLNFIGGVATALEAAVELANDGGNWIWIVSLLVGIAHVLLSCLLLIGIGDNNPTLILFWLVAEVINLVV